MGSDFGIKIEYLRLMQEILAKVEKLEKAVIFGSRAKGTNKPHSDVDIALFGDLNILSAERVRLDMEELPTPYSFDIVDFDGIKNPQLRRHIERVGVEIYKA